MSETELYVILNPHADKGRARRREQQIVDIFARDGHKVVVAYTEQGTGASELARKAALEGRNTIVAAGGDGTVNEVCDGVLKALSEQDIEKPSVGIIPIGRGNDFAWGMGIPKDIEKACALILKGNKRLIDVGLAVGGKYPQGKYFVNGLGVGFEPLVNFIASDFKHVTGTPSYVLALIKILIHYPDPYDVELTLDGKVLRLKTQQVSICNGRRMGSAFLMGPDALFDDGYFDVVFAKEPVPSNKLVPIALTFFKGGQVKLPQFQVVRAKSIKMVSFDNPLPVHVDGEEISKGCMAFSVELFPSILPVFS